MREKIKNILLNFFILMITPLGWIIIFLCVGMFYISNIEQPELREQINFNPYHVEVRSPTTNELVFSDDVKHVSDFYFGVGVTVTYYNRYRREIAGNAIVYDIGWYESCWLTHLKRRI